ncbi:MAG TPA: FAD-dependent oxidoreductase [Candidatus Acidoferrum sp.]|nr:FAD-dependent oxidoreductase [Candidatus Acidoferrum sp.]
MTAERSTVVIIGAGPAGLALGRELRQRGIQFAILEQAQVGESWRRMPKQLKLVSPWKWNYLHASSRGLFSPNAQLTRAEFLEYLTEFARESKLMVMNGCAVRNVKRSSEGFAIHTSRGEFTARIVVNATGYFSNPLVPEIPGTNETEIPRIHYAQYSDAQEIASRIGRGGSVLLVGKRLSAGQIALELFDAGLNVGISHRTPIQFGVDDWLWPLIYRTFAHVEALRLCFGPGRKIDVRMPGGRVRKLIESGAIKCFPAIVKFERDAAELENGATLSPRLIIFATGFAPALTFLGSLALETCPETGVPLTRNMESVSVPDLFFLGFEMVRNFQSRFLRGIRKDTVRLANTIEARLASEPVRASKDLSGA